MAVSVVEVAVGTSVNSATPTVALSNTPAAGDVIVVVWTSYTWPGATFSSGSGCGASWSHAFGESNGTQRYIVGTGANASGTITITMSTAKNCVLIAYLIRGLSSTTVAGVERYIGSASTAKLSSGQTADSGQCVISTHRNNVSSPAFTIPTSGSLPSSGAWTGQTPAANVFGHVATAHAIPSSSGSYTSEATAASGSPEWYLSQIKIGSAGAAVNLTGVTANVTVAAPAGTVQTVTPSPVSLTGVTADVAVTAPAGSVTAPVSLTGVTANVTVAAPAGTVVAGSGTTPVNLTGVTADIDVAAPAGTVTAPVSLTGVTADVVIAAPAGLVFTGSDGAESYTDAGAEADGPLDADLDAGAESYAEAGGDATGPTAVESETLDAYAMSWATATSDLVVVTDPATLRPQPRLVVVDMDGNEIATLDNAVMGNPSRVLNSRGGFDFTLGKNDPKIGYCTQLAEVQVWRGGAMVPGAWFVIVDPPLEHGASSYKFACSGLRWHLENRIIGDELPELLTNGGFEAGEAGWNFTYAEGSVPAAPPLHRIVPTALEGGKALELAGADKSQLIKKTIESLAIFVPNEATFLAGGEQKIRDEVQDILENSSVVVEGHTADADGGTGYTLSVNRALAAKAVIEDERSDLTVTAIGKGETEPVDPRHTEAAYRKNRRIVIIATTVQEATGHRQYAYKRFWFTNPTTARKAVEIDGIAWADLVLFRGPSKDGWILYLERRKASDLTKLIESATVDINEDFPLEAWTPMHAQVKAPADGVSYRYEIRLYPTAGKTLFDHVSVKPNLRSDWWHTDQCTTIAGLVQEAQNLAHGKSDLKIGTLTPASGEIIDRSYEWSRRYSVDSQIDEIVAREAGPDFDIEVTATLRVARTYWPRKGARRVARFALGDRAVAIPRILTYASGPDGDRIATTAIVQSSLSGGGQLEAFVRSPREDGYVAEHVFRTEQNLPVPSLLSQGQAAVRYGQTDVVTSVAMDPAWTSWLLENVDIGDTVDLDILDGQTVVAAEYRIVGQELNMEHDTLLYDVVLEGVL